MNRDVSPEFRHAVVFFVLLLLAALVFGCAGGKANAPGKYPLSGKSYVINGKRYYVLASAKGYEEKGEASWYGGKFQGRRTASGEIYDMHELTCAHKTLPLQTWLRVANLKNGREVNVRVNDRGPFARDRIVDLSYAAATELGIVHAGTAPVLVQALGRTEERKVDGRVQTVLVQPQSYSVGRFSVQVASLQNRENAQHLARQLEKKYGRAYVTPFDRGDAMFYRVQVADETVLGRAIAVQAELEKSGYPDCFVVAR